MNWLRFFILVVVMSILGGQASAQGVFGGLSNTALPGPDSSSNFGWRPFVGLTANYFHNLTTLESTGVQSRDLFGVGIMGGLNGTKSWGRTSLGVAYRGFGRFASYSTAGFNVSQNHMLALGVTHRMTSRLTLFGSHLAGITDGGMGFGSLIGGVGGMAPINYFNSNPALGNNIVDTTLGNPSNNNVVDNEVFDSKVYFLTGTGGFTYNLTERSSFSGGAAGAYTRRTQGQFGMQGYSLRGSYNYRLNATTVVGLHYGFGALDYYRAFGTVYNNSYVASMQHSFSRRFFINASGGIFNVHSEFVGTVPLDPEMAAILGKPNGLQIVKTNNWFYSASLDINKSYQRSMLAFFARRQFFPGNGLMLASNRTIGGVSYTYNAANRLALSGGVDYSYISGILQNASYSNYGANLTANYRVGDDFHIRIGVMYRVLNRPNNAPALHQVGVLSGLMWSPGNVALPF